MTFKKGNTIGAEYRFNKDNQPQGVGRKKNPLREWLNRCPVEVPSAEEYADTQFLMFCLPQKKLEEIRSDESLPMLLRTCADDALNRKKAQDKRERAADRKFGKPTQRTEAQIDAGGVSVTISGGEGIPARETENCE